MGESIEGVNLEERVVLLALAHRERAGETPTTAVDLVGPCRDYLDAVDADVIGRVTEAEVARSLNSLSATPLVEERCADPSATGKGRTRYALGEEATSVLDRLSTDKRLQPVVGIR